MKKKLILGLGLLLLVFVIGAGATIYNLFILMESDNMVKIQDVVVDKANEMLLQIKGAQSELYRHKAGYSRDINAFVDHVLGLEEHLTLTERDYSPYIHKASCNDCHPAEEHIGHYKEIINDVKRNLEDFKKITSLILTSQELHQKKESEAISITFLIINDLEKMKHIATVMKEKIKNRHERETSGVLLAIILTSLFSFILAFIIVNILFRKINRPLTHLLTGIKRLSSGDFGHQITAITEDEFGEVAEKFNQMARDLKAATAEKDRLLENLQLFNMTLEKKVSEVTSELMAANESIRRNEILAVVGTLAAGVSHELSTPLGTILGFVQIFKTQIVADNELMEDLALVEHELLRCNKIVSDLLDAVKSNKNESVDTEINEVVIEALNLLHYQPAMKKIDVCKDLASALPTIRADRWQIKQVFINILMNAMQAMPEGGRLTVLTLSSGNGGVEISIADTGKGIPRAEQEKIFKPFYTTRDGGSGLGLSISDDLIRKHGGQIKLKSAPGEGAVFTISLPRSNNPEVLAGEGNNTAG